MNIGEYLIQPKWPANLPFYKQRNTTCNKRLLKLTKSTYKKLLFYLDLPQNTVKLILKIFEEQSHLFKNLTLRQQKLLLISYLEHLKHILNLFNKNFISKKLNIEIKTRYNNYNIKHELGILPNTNTQKTTLYTTWLAINYQFAIKKSEQIPAFINTVISLSELNYIYSFLIQNTNYLQLKNTFIPKAQKPYKVPTIPLYLIDTSIAIFNYYKYHQQVLQNNKITKSILNFIPIFYKKHFKQFFIAKTTYLGLANFINSKKKAKKYLRILHKRLGLYKKKKKKWI